MPRKTNEQRRIIRTREVASMRPRPDAAENVDFVPAVAPLLLLQ